MIELTICNFLHRSLLFHEPKYTAQIENYQSTGPTKYAEETPIINQEH